LRIYLQNADGTLSEPTSPETIAAADCALLWVDIDDPGSAPAQLIGKDCQIDLLDFESFKEGTDNPRLQQRPDDLLMLPPWRTLPATSWT